MSVTHLASKPFEFLLPDIGEGVVEGEIVRWLVKEGDALTEDQPMVEVMTDKATVEIPSPRKGRVSRLLWKEGDLVPVHKPLLVIDLEDGAAGKGLETTAAKMVMPGLGAELPTARTAQAAPFLAAAPGAVPPTGGRVLATPATRKLARELGIDLATVAGSGPGGRVTKEDVRTAGGTAPSPTIRVHPAAVAPAPAEAGHLEERVPLKGLRRKIAEKMVQSAYTAPHVTYVDEADLTELVALRQRGKALADAQGVRLSYLPFVMKAVVAALRKFPELNASLDNARQEIVLRRYYHLGIATATDQGLLVPVVRNVDQKGILALAKEVQQLSIRAREGKSQLSDLTGSTFTISSVGNIGGLFATPIINYPEVAILGFNKIHPRPVVRDGQVVVRQMTYLALSFDHRVIDGALAADFMNALIQYLQDPSLLMLE